MGDGNVSGEVEVDRKWNKFIRGIILCGATRGTWRTRTNVLILGL
jgi:hypothetical protein